MEEKVKMIINDLKPYLNMDGGDIEYIKIEDNYVFVKLYGACKDCMYQDDTLKGSIEEAIKSEIPEIKGVINIDL